MNTNKYLILIILFLFAVILSYFYLSTDVLEGFDTTLIDVLPVQISKDDSSITVPNKVKGINGDDITFGGNIKTPVGWMKTLNSSQLATVQQLNVNADTNLNQVKVSGPTRIVGSNVLELGADTGKSWDGNGSISYKTSWDPNALNIVGAENGGPRKVHLWDDVEVDGNLYVNGGNVHVNGSITIGSNEKSWNISVRENGWLEFLYNGTSRDNYNQDSGHIIMSPDGNLWLPRSSYYGWVADNLQTIANK